MKHAKKIEIQLKKLRYEQTKDSRQRVLHKVTDALEGHRQSKPANRPPVWRIRMNSKMTKLAAAALIIIAGAAGIHFLGGSIDGTSVAWAKIVREVQQSHNEYYADLLLAVEAKDADLVADRADALSEFWQAIGYLAEAKRGQPTQFHPEDSVKVVREITLAGMFQENEQEIFRNNARKFVDWVNAIKDPVWLDETVHVCKQLEEYGEEIRDAGRDPEVNFSHAAHCMLSLIHI